MTIIDAEFVRFLRVFRRACDGECGAGKPVGSVLADSLKRALITASVGGDIDD